MKKLLLITSLFLFSCQKELTEIKQETRTIAAKSLNAVQTAEVKSLIWNPCTEEWMQLSGYLLYQIKDKVAEFHYTNVVGTGLTTGNTYQASGHQIQVLTSNTEMFLYNVLFTIPGSANNLSQSIEVHLNAGVVESFNFTDAYCQ